VALCDKHCSGGVVGYHVCLTRRRSRVQFSARILLYLLEGRWLFCQNPPAVFRCLICACEDSSRRQALVLKKQRQDGDLNPGGQKPIDLAGQLPRPSCLHDKLRTANFKVPCNTDRAVGAGPKLCTDYKHRVCSTTKLKITTTTTCKQKKQKE
jgi:hypothetical protein